MKKLFATLLTACVFCSISFAQARKVQDDSMPKDSIEGAKDNRIELRRRSVVLLDTVRNKPDMDKLYGKPTYDAFKNKMKEPWLGDLFKDILFR